MRVPDVSYDVVLGEYYYCRGEVKLYTGNGYTIDTCNSTPNIRVPLNAIVTTNERGEIYGSELYLKCLGLDADLIQVLGNSGSIGYVKSTDLNYDNVSSISDAVTYMNAPEANRIIPVYESDGVTVIDTFTIYSGGTLEVVEAG